MLGRRALSSKIASWSAFLPRWRIPEMQEPLVALCVYRQRNAENVLEFLDQLPTGSDVRLHALDRTDTRLSANTIGTGAGSRMVLLRGLLESSPLGPDSWLLLFDDDAVFVRNGRTCFLDFAASAEVDVAGPSIQTGQAVSHMTMKTHPLRTVREVGFLEVGPVVAFSPRARSTLEIFHPHAAMGWGSDIRWAAQARRLGLRMGIVDATPILHRGALGAAYDNDAEVRQVASAFKETGLNWEDLSVPNARSWRPWQRRAPWTT